MDATTGNFLDITWFVQYWSSSSKINISPWRYCKTKEKAWTGQNTGGKATLKIEECIFTQIWVSWSSCNWECMIVFSSDGNIDNDLKLLLLFQLCQWLLIMTWSFCNVDANIRNLWDSFVWLSTCMIKARNGQNCQVTSPFHFEKTNQIVSGEKIYNWFLHIQKAWLFYLLV